MCLAVPGEVIEWIEREPPFASALIEFGGVRRQVNMACMTDAVKGDFVLVHAGIAISCIDPDEAAKICEAIELIDSEEGDLPAGDEAVVDEE